MELKSGTKLGPYEILERVGAGGMGEVWKSRDTRLGRTVAIKVCREKFSERFNREARLIAALNHPNICQLHDVGPDYLVMEYVEGTPVAPVDSARKLLDIAVQMSEGLAAAHAAGIIHRDLKPENILITTEGRVKILDFGLAKAAIDDISESSADDLTRTIHHANPVTEAGTTVGTIAYMSPEQARGKSSLTPQSDQFSLGLVLYELVAGQRAFERGSAAELMTAIIREDTEPLPMSVPAPLRWVIERLLSKDPADRYDSTRDLYRELRQLRDRLPESVSASAIPAMGALTGGEEGLKRARLAAGLAAVVLAGVTGWMLRPAEGAANQVFTPMEVSWESPASPIWSPDGKAFVYVAGAAGARRILLRYMNSPAATALTQEAALWSPVGWTADSKRAFAIGPNPQLAAAGEKSLPYALFSVPVIGGDPELIAPVDANLRGSAIATISPDGKTFAIARKAEDGRYAVFTASPPGSPLQRYAPAPFEARGIVNSLTLQFSPDSKWLTLFIDVPGDRQAWRLPFPAGQGVPRRFLESIRRFGHRGTPQLSWFPNGRTGVLEWAREDGFPRLWMAGIRSGPGRRITSGTSSSGEFSPSVSPDGKKILFLQGHTDYMILSASIKDASTERVISSELPLGMPAWASRGEKFAYESDRNGSAAVWMRADGWDRPIVTTAAFPPGTTTWFLTPALSPGADRVIYKRVDQDLNGVDWISSVSGGSPVRLTNVNGGVEDGGVWSPDGGRFAYIQVRNGVDSLMVAKTNGEATPVVLRDDLRAIQLPDWSPDGKWITFFEQREGDPVGGSWKLISADGKTVRSLAGANGGKLPAASLAFSRDSQHLYGIRSEQDHNYLFSIDIPAGNVENSREKIIGDVGKDFSPKSYLTPGVRFSLSPDGARILFPSFRLNSNLWMMEGFEPPGWIMELREMLPW